jgi:hypothetical protein
MIKKNKLYLSHGSISCYDSNTDNNLYFKSVLKYCIDFLNEHKKETIILHLKRESIDNSIKNDYISRLIESTILEKYNDNKLYHSINPPTPPHKDDNEYNVNISSPLIQSYRPPKPPRKSSSNV